MDTSIERTMNNQSEIPFLRSNINPSDLSKTHTGGFGGVRSLSHSKPRGKKPISVKKLVRKEIGWNNYIKPISKYNCQVHPSMRIEFE